MDDTNEDEWSDEKVLNLVKAVTKSCEVDGEELHMMLKLRLEGKLDFLLIDIREIIEYSHLSIKGTDLLFPTSTIHLHLDELKKLSSKPLVFYCRTANRTAQMISILRRMGFDNIAHLSGGIVDFRGEKLKNAPLPKFKEKK